MEIIISVFPVVNLLLSLIGFCLRYHLLTVFALAEDGLLRRRAGEQVDETNSADPGPQRHPPPNGQ